MSNTIYAPPRKRASSQIIKKLPDDSSGLIFKIKRQSNIFLKSKLKPKIRNISNSEKNQTSLADSEDIENAFFEKMQKIQSEREFNHNINLNQKQNDFICDYIKSRLMSFYLIMKDEYKQGCNGIIKKLSQELTVDEKLKNSIVFRYGESSNRYYIIFKGAVDVLYPYCERVSISPKDFIVYLLRLKKYHELVILSQVFELNSALFQFDMKKFDLWITIAYNTLIKGRKFRREREMEMQEGFNRELSPHNAHQQHKQQHHSLSPIKHKDKKKISKKLVHGKDNEGCNVNKNYDDDDYFINLNDYAKDYHFLNSIEYELINAMRLVNPKRSSFIGELPPKQIATTSNEYINRLVPERKSNQPEHSLKDIILIKYYLQQTYKVGNAFGEIAIDSKPEQLNSVSLNRLFTAITREDSHLGSFSKKVFFDYIKPANDRNQKAKIVTLKAFSIFAKSKKHQLIKNYSSCFTEVKVQHGDLLFKEHQTYDDNQKVYFIKEGEFELICNRSINDIDQLLIETGNEEVIRDRKRINLKPETAEYFSAFTTKTIFCINVYKSNEIIGLNDSFFNGKYLYSARCKGNMGFVYQINMNLLKYIISNDETIIQSTQEIVESKRRLLVNYLLKYRDMRLEFSFQFNKSKEFNTGKRLDLEIFKREKSLPYIPWISFCTTIKDSDIDLSLKNTSHRITLADDRRRRTLIFRKKYDENMKNINNRRNEKREKGKDKHKEGGHRESRAFSFENRLINSASSPRVIEYNYRSNMGTISCKTQREEAKIDPLIFDNFNRMYNTSFYYQNLFNRSKKQVHLQFKVNHEKKEEENNNKSLKRNAGCLSSSCIIKTKKDKRKSYRNFSKELLNTKLNLIYNHSVRRRVGINSLI